MITQQEGRQIRIVQHTRPITDTEYDDLCECRCALLPGTHTAGQCTALPAAS